MRNAHPRTSHGFQYRALGSEVALVDLETDAAGRTSNGSIGIGSTTVTQFFYRAASRGEQFRGDYQKLYDEGIQIALK